MAGQGPPPKDPKKRARTNKDVIPLRVLPIVATVRPPLPTFNMLIKVDGDVIAKEFEWPEITREWWDMLSEHPLAFEFIDTDWSYLMDTARIHAEYWMGNLSLASELRLREAKYGFTPDDRARLRISFAMAHTAEQAAKEAGRRPSARERFPTIVMRPEIDSPDELEA